MSHEIQVVQQDTAVMAVAPAAVSLGTLQAATASALVRGAREMANALADVIERQKLMTVIQGRKHVNVEGWTTLAVMLGVVAREVQTTEKDGIYTAIVELIRMSDGACISRASAECGDEKPWNQRARYARRSMAQTRATGKACRLAFSWIMSLAGYEPTPAEEMPQQSDDDLLISSAQHKMLEARISELGLNREGVKTWMSRRFCVDHFQALQKNQFSELLQQLPRMAEAKAKRMGAKVEIMEENAKDLRAVRPYKSGKTGYRQAEEAAILESEARHIKNLAEA